MIFNSHILFHFSFLKIQAISSWSICYTYVCVEVYVKYLKNCKEKEKLVDIFERTLN